MAIAKQDRLANFFHKGHLLYYRWFVREVVSSRLYHAYEWRVKADLGRWADGFDHYEYEHDWGWRWRWR